jgi:hypothetical protein
MKIRRPLVVIAAALLAVVLMPVADANADTVLTGSRSGTDGHGGCYTIKTKGHDDVLVYSLASRNKYGGFAGYGIVGTGYGCHKPNTTPVSYMALYHLTLMTEAGKIISEVNGGSTHTSTHVGAYTRHVLCGSHTVKFRVRATVGYAYTDGAYTSAFNVYGPYFNC